MALIRLPPFSPMPRRNLESRSGGGHLAEMHFCFLLVQDSPVSLPSLPLFPLLFAALFILLHLTASTAPSYFRRPSLSVPPRHAILSASRGAPTPPGILRVQSAPTSRRVALLFSIRSSYMPPTTDCQENATNLPHGFSFSSSSPVTVPPSPATYTTRRCLDGLTTRGPAPR